MENILTIEEIEKLLEEKTEEELSTKEIKIEKFDTITEKKLDDTFSNKDSSDCLEC